MRHADEGTLHSFLDRELSPVEVEELERHLSVCVPCRALLAEARTFMAEADELVVALDVQAPKASAPTIAMPARGWRPRPATLGWAATVILAVGLGYSLRPGVVPPTSPVVASRQDAAQPAVEAPSAPANEPRGAARPIRPPADVPAASPVSLAGAALESPPPSLLANQGASAAAAHAAADAATPVGKTTATAGIAFVDGAPVDTGSRGLSFGPSPTPAPRRITLDEAVAHLGGTIRLIDGLAPQRVELLSGVDVPGADPDRQVIRIYYEEPDLGLVTLDQQRPGPSYAARDDRDRRFESAAPTITVNPVPTSRAPRAMARAPLPTSTLAWRSDGTWLALTSRLSGARMTELQARVK